MANARLLVVEDESIVAKDIQNRLRNLGYDVPTVVAYGDKAVEKVAELHPDLVLMDIFLKGDMDGIQAAEQIRTRYDIPVIFLTAFADPKTLQRAKITEPFGYILKPFEERELLTAIEMALYKHGMEKKLKDSERWLSTTLKSIDDAIIATDTAGKIMLMNPVAEALTGWKEAESLGKDISGVFCIVDEKTGSPLSGPGTAEPGNAGRQERRQAGGRVQPGPAPGRQEQRGRHRAGVPGHYRASPDRRDAAVHPVLGGQGERRGILGRPGRAHPLRERGGMPHARIQPGRAAPDEGNRDQSRAHHPGLAGTRTRIKDAGALTFESVHRTKAGRLYPVEVVVNYVQV